MMTALYRITLPAILMATLISSGCGTSRTMDRLVHSSSRYTLASRAMRPQAVGDSIRVVSYNIKHAMRVKKAAELLESHDELNSADVLCLQEMDGAGVRHIADTLGMNYIYYPALRHPGTQRDFGNAVLSRWPVRGDRKLVLPEVRPRNMPRIIVGAAIEIGDKRLDVYCLHTDVVMPPDERRRQAEFVVNAISESADFVVVAGDFNTYTGISRAAVQDVFDEAGFTHATADAGWTYKHWYLLNKKSTLDHIFARNMDVVSAGRVPDRTASDHMPLWAEFRFPADQIVLER